MKILIIAVGKEKDFAGHELVTDYTVRIGHYLPLEWMYIPASDMQEEGKRIVKVLDNQGTGGHVVLLDEKGKELTSVELSSFIQGKMNQGMRALTFIIGGAHGFDPAVKERAQTTFALSKLTFPHQLVRLILAEQLYRACTIMKGEKYHHV